ncbi:GNAT family N-acetyltransferase [Anaerosacchariphilus polymeriproducens]|uniref:GNAT family N-acetyltransferase n=1 Tax=Anaerosacchariphilus polymeriproducens TaxID=1812858 RepID=A0A371AVY1_9FIRM|nr:GNAT family N-acetyltransferase [Anaerosacchariphilus polymeriproducens]RDU23735.1 GNAT family N-acetyltransferase [Anaerosacchariphilus polymeriproducens]
MINLLGDFGMHWLLKEFVVDSNYRGKLIGTMLYHFSEKYIQSTMKEGWKVAIDLRSSVGLEKFYSNLGFSECPNESMGNGMEKIIFKH